MFKKLVIPALTGILSIAALGAYAQTASTPTNSGAMAPAGQGPGTGTTGSEISRGSTQSRAGVAAQTRQAEAGGRLQPAGEAPDPVGGAAPAKSAKKAASGHHRTKVKHRARVTQPRTHTLTPAADPMTEPKK